MISKVYIASFQNGKGECWDIEFFAISYKDARRIARGWRKEFGKLWSLRLKR